MRVIGLTGGIGAGKTTVADVLRQHGAVIIDADQIARDLTAPGSPLLADIATAFNSQSSVVSGQSSATKNQKPTLDRVKLAQLVFANPEARKKLEAILHPPILAEAARRVAELRNSQTPPPAAVIVAPLLFEAHAEDMVEKVIVVYADEQIRIKRLQARDNLNEAEIRARFSAQNDPGEQQKKADWVVDNSGSRGTTEQQVNIIWQEILNIRG